MNNTKKPARVVTRATYESKDAIVEVDRMTRRSWIRSSMFPTGNDFVQEQHVRRLEMLRVRPEREIPLHSSNRNRAITGWRKDASRPLVDETADVIDDSSTVLDHDEMAEHLTSFLARIPKNLDDEQLVALDFLLDGKTRRDITKYGNIGGKDEVRKRVSELRNLFGWILDNPIEAANGDWPKPPPPRPNGRRRVRRELTSAERRKISRRVIRTLTKVVKVSRNCTEGRARDGPCTEDAVVPQLYWLCPATPWWVWQRLNRPSTPERRHNMTNNITMFRMAFAVGVSHVDVGQTSCVPGIVSIKPAPLRGRRRRRLYMLRGRPRKGGGKLGVYCTKPTGSFRFRKSRGAIKPPDNNSTDRKAEAIRGAMRALLSLPGFAERGV